jgi:hypothetical protein
MVVQSCMETNLAIGCSTDYFLLVCKVLSVAVTSDVSVTRSITSTTLTRAANSELTLLSVPHNLHLLGKFQRCGSPMHKVRHLHGTPADLPTYT